MTTNTGRKPVLWRMPCPCCGEKKAYSIMMDVKNRLYARCSFDCGIAFADTGIVRWVQRNQSHDIEPTTWDTSKIAHFLRNHWAFQVPS